MAFLDVFPAPQRLLDPRSRDYRPGLAAFVPGGRYLSVPCGRDLTEATVARAVIDVTGEAPSFRVEGEAIPADRRAGTVLRVNLFRRDAGWRWAQIPAGLGSLATLVSLETSKAHHYCLRAEFECPLTLARYADQPSEPRLRPTTYGVLHPGPEIGSILLRGVERPVHGLIVITPKLTGAMMFR